MSRSFPNGESSSTMKASSLDADSSSADLRAPAERTYDFFGDDEEGFLRLEALIMRLLDEVRSESNSLEGDETGGGETALRFWRDF